MKTDYRAAIGSNNKSRLQSICEMLGNLCGISTNQHVATTWIVRSQLSCLVENVD